MLTVRDASAEGCGVCRSVHLSPAGRKALSACERMVRELGGEDIGVIDVFGGIGGFRKALALMHLHPSVYVHSEVCPECSRAFTMRVMCGHAFLKCSRIVWSLPLPKRRLAMKLNTFGAMTMVFGWKVEPDCSSA